MQVSRMYTTGSHTQITPDASTDITPPNYQNSLGVIVQTNGQMRYTLDGTTPTTTVGFRLTSTDGERLIPMTGRLKVINEVAGQKVDYVFVGGF